jgi:diadenosine tetraphosphate (Ap4A) HIT family hydrolase
VKYLWRVIAVVLVFVALLWLFPRTRAFIADLLFSLARNPAMGNVVGWGFEHFSLVLPLEHVLLTDKTIAFNHPRPTWEKHILVIPRKQITTIFELTNDKPYLEDMWRTAREVFSDQAFTPESYALLVNGGIRQDVKQVHFHLNGEKEYVPAFTNLAESSLILKTKDFNVYQLTENPLHLILVPEQAIPALSVWQEADIQKLSGIELPLQELEQAYSLSSRGFSLITQEVSKLEGQRLSFHITAGTLEE